MSKGLEALRKIGLMTTKRNLQDFPIGNQPKQIVKMKIKEMPEFQEVLNAINELERLKKFKETFDNYELAKKQDFIAYENWLECEAELKKSPTVEEVCKAIQEELPYGTVKYIKGNKEFMFLNHGEKQNITDVYGDRHKITGFYKSSTITMIGKFYESLEEEKNEKRNKRF